MSKFIKVNLITMALLAIPLLMIFSVPKYPIIDDSLSEQNISENIKKVIKENSKKFSFENMYDKKQVLVYEKNLITLANNLDSCKTKECLVEEYNHFMDSWVSTEIKAKIRYVSISNKFGFIGNMMNENLYWLYTFL